MSYFLVLKPRPMKRFVALMMCAVSLFSAAQCDIENPCALPPNSIAGTPDGEPLYHFVDPIGGLQFDHAGEIHGFSGGALESAGFTVSMSATTVLAFNFVGNTIPPGCGVLAIVESSSEWYNFISDMVFSDENGAAINIQLATFDECACPEGYVASCGGNGGWILRP